MVVPKSFREKVLEGATYLVNCKPLHNANEALNYAIRYNRFLCGELRRRCIHRGDDDPCEFKGTVASCDVCYHTQDTVVLSDIELMVLQDFLATYMNSSDFSEIRCAAQACLDAQASLTSGY